MINDKGVRRLYPAEDNQQRYGQGRRIIHTVTGQHHFSVGSLELLDLDRYVL